MKKLKYFLPVLIIAGLTACGRNGQVEAPFKYTEVSRKLAEEFNGRRFGSIYAMYSDSVRGILSEKDSESSLTALYGQIGKIKKLTFERSFKVPYSKDSMAVFRIDCAGSDEPLSLSMILDRDKRFAELSFLPYVSEGVPYLR